MYRTPFPGCEEGREGVWKLHCACGAAVEECVETDVSDSRKLQGLAL